MRDALRFYVERDTDPDRWYPVSNRHVHKFDDLPSIYRDNMDLVDAPLTLHLGQEPVWDDQDIDDVIAFLRTMEDRDVTREMSKE